MTKAFYKFYNYCSVIIKILFLFLSIQCVVVTKTLANYYTCTYTNTKNTVDQINFTKIGNQIIMTGGGFNGKYQVISERKNKGIIAAKSLEIDGSFNAEIILLDLEKMTFSYTSYLSDTGVDKNSQLDGSCLRDQ